MNLVQIYTCDCNPYNYSTRQTYQAHLHSKRHQLWESKQTIRDFRERIVDLENQMSRLRTELQIWKSQAINLKQRYEPSDLLD